MQKLNNFFGENYVGPLCKEGPYEESYLCGQLCLWWDDRAGDQSGWCLRISRSRWSQEDIPIGKPGRNYSPRGLWRLICAELGGYRIANRMARTEVLR